MVLNKTVWVLNSFFEILGEEFMIIRQGQVPVEVGGCPGLGCTCQSTEALTDTAVIALIVLKVEDTISAQWGQKTV